MRRWPSDRSTYNSAHMAASRLLERYTVTPTGHCPGFPVKPTPPTLRARPSEPSGTTGALPFVVMLFVANSTPMVDFDSKLNSSRVNLPLRKPKPVKKHGHHNASGLVRATRSSSPVQEIGLCSAGMGWGNWEHMGNEHAKNDNASSWREGAPAARETNLPPVHPTHLPTKTDHSLGSLFSLSLSRACKPKGPDAQLCASWRAVPH